MENVSIWKETLFVQSLSLVLQLHLLPLYLLCSFLYIRSLLSPVTALFSQSQPAHTDPLLPLVILTPPVSVNNDLFLLFLSN